MRRESTTCGKKIQYASWEDAEQAVQELIAKSPTEVVSRYRCKFCEHWHVGHPRRKYKKIAAKRLEKARRKQLWKDDRETIQHLEETS